VRKTGARLTLHLDVADDVMRRRVALHVTECDQRWDDILERMGDLEHKIAKILEPELPIDDALSGEKVIP